jgi:hypothetical protein
LLIEPKDQEMVNQQLPVFFFWTPRGFGRSYDLQVSKNPAFATLDIDEMDLTETRYTLATLEPGAIYYWRVRTINDGGIGDWSTRSFTAVAPKIEITAPNGGEQWQRGLTVFIRWHDNVSEDVVIELYRGESVVETIATVPSTGAYEWEVGLDLEPGDDYSVQVKSTADKAVADASDATFTVK